MQIRYKIILTGLLPAAFLSVTGQVAAQEETSRKPNIVFIFADDLGWSGNNK